MSDAVRRARDLALLDAVDACPRMPFDGHIWRLVCEGRDPTMGSPSRSRWCDGTFDVLYTSLDYDGAVAEVHALLSLQPVFPSKIRWMAHQLIVAASETLDLADLDTLDRLGVDTARYAERDYSRTSEIAGAAYFLGFDGLLAPRARWPCTNLVLFTDRIAPDRLRIAEAPAKPVAWQSWQKRRRPTAP